MARDTAEDWQHISEVEPWHGVLSAPEFLSANITEAGKESFYAQGREEIDEVMSTLRKLFGDIRPGRALDFGTGLGRLAFPMSTYCAHVYGLDIAPAMLREATVQRDLRGIHNVTFADTMPAEVQYDWINSYIAFQHIPPRTGYALLRRLLDNLQIGGVVSLQITYAHDAREVSLLHQEVRAYSFDGETMTVIDHLDRDLGRISMFDYDMNRVLYLVGRSGIREITLRATDHGGAHGFWIFGCKSA